MFKKLNSLFIQLTFILACFPILSFKIRSLVTILWSLIGIILFFNNKTKKKLKIDIWSFLLPFLFLCFSLIYSKNLQYGFALLLKMLSLIIFPFIFYLHRNLFIGKTIKRILYLFVFSVLFLVIFQMIQVFIDFEYLNQNITLNEIKINGFNSMSEISQSKLEQIRIRRFRNFIIEKSNTHPTYQAMWIVFALYVLLSKALKLKGLLIKCLMLLVLLVLSVWLYFLSARMPLIAMFLSLSLTLFIFFKHTKKKKLIFGLTIPLLLILLMFFKNPFSTRIKEYHQNGFSIPKEKFNSKNFNSSNVRNGVYFCDFNLIKRNYIKGVGVGDIQDKLNDCYFSEVRAKVYTWRDYNSHNQYAFFWISSGVFGLLFFLFLIIFLLYNSLRKKNSILFFLICFVSLIFLSENILERSDGVVFFSFFIALLYFNNLKENNISKPLLE